MRNHFLPQFLMSESRHRLDSLRSQRTDPAFCLVEGTGRRPAAGRLRLLPGRAPEQARAKEPISHFLVQLCFCLEI